LFAGLGASTATAPDDPCSMIRRMTADAFRIRADAEAAGGYRNDASAAQWTWIVDRSGRRSAESACARGGMGALPLTKSRSMARSWS